MGRQRKRGKVEAKVMPEERRNEEKPENSLVKISHYPDGTSRIFGRRRRIFRPMSSEPTSPLKNPPINIKNVTKVKSKLVGTKKPKKKKDFPTSSSSRRRSKRIRNATSVLRQPIKDTLFDHYFRNIWSSSPEERRSQFTYLNCVWFYMYTNEQYRERVLSWIKKQKIFSKTYVFVPIVLRFHWSLLIFCHLGESLDSKTTTPCILLLDSLHTFSASRRLKPLIRRFIVDIFKTEDRSEDLDLIKRIPILVPKVPQQRNDMECGVYVLYYVNKFLESAPQCFSISNGYPYFLKEDWFTEEEMEGFYDRLESLGVESSDSEEGSESGDFEGVTIERKDFLKARQKRQS